MHGRVSLLWFDDVSIGIDMERLPKMRQIPLQGTLRVIAAVSSTISSISSLQGCLLARGPGYFGGLWYWRMAPGSALSCRLQEPFRHASSSTGDRSHVAAEEAAPSGSSLLESLDLFITVGIRVGEPGLGIAKSSRLVGDGTLLL